jgi:mRNA-degrading endonuclease RelE of RelBE toxin-antitoxin system
MAMYVIRFARGVETDLKKIKPYYRRRILDEIDAQLGNEPTTPTQHRKQLVDLVPPWPAEPPIWQLSIGDCRVFYDVVEEQNTVYVRAVRGKPPGKTTEEIL